MKNEWVVVIEEWKRPTGFLKPVCHIFISRSPSENTGVAACVKETFEEDGNKLIAEGISKILNMPESEWKKPIKFQPF